MSQMILQINGEEITLENLKRSGNQLHFTLDGVDYHFTASQTADGLHLLKQQMQAGMQRNISLSVWRAGKQGVQIALAGTQALVAEPLAIGAQADHAGASCAPMPGQVIEILVKTGDKVEKGQALAVMEAMKLQTTLSASKDGVVEAILVAVGEKVEEGAEIVRLAE
jgi:biotin carboxyl carrier protein